MDVRALRHVPFEDVGRLAGVLARRGARTVVHDVPTDTDWEAAARNADLLIVLGGPIGADDTPVFPWLLREREIVADRLLHRQPTLGICLGAQIMARALGVAVAPGPVEIGWKPLRLTAWGRDSVLAPLDGLSVLHWHGDHIAATPELPSLATTDVGPVQAFAHGSGLGLQFHLEVEAGSLEAWYVGHSVELASNQVPVSALRQQAAASADALIPACDSVFNNWLDSL